MAEPATARLIRALCLGDDGLTELRAWTESDLRRGVKLARHEGAELWLARRAEDAGVMPHNQQYASWRRALDVAALSGLRVDAQTERVVDYFTEWRIPFVLIKGPALRAVATEFPYANARATTDVDVLVPEDAAHAAWEALISHGYREAEAASALPADHIHLPSLCDAHGVAVEVHVTTTPWVKPAEAWRRATSDGLRVTWHGRNVDVPNATELLWHALAHAFAQDPVHTYRMRFILDAAAVLAASPRVNWDTIRERLAAGEVREPRWRDTPRVVSDELAKRWLVAAARLGGSEIPSDLAGAGAVSLERIAEWRAAVRRMPIVRARDRLLEDGIRCEVGLLPTSSSPGTPALLRARRRIATSMSRLAYRAWRKTVQQ